MIIKLCIANKPVVDLVNLLQGTQKILLFSFTIYISLKITGIMNFFTHLKEIIKKLKQCTFCLVYSEKKK